MNKTLKLIDYEDRQISIITNFGCRSKCWYCVWNKHPLKTCCDNTNWTKLQQFLEQYKHKKKVSLSGGGDCLYDFENNQTWWNTFLNITNSKHILVDVHSREKNTHFEWIKQNINRFVFSSDNLDIPNVNISNMSDRQYLKMLSEFVKIRIVHVVTKNTTFEMIEEYLKFQQEIQCQFTIKQLFGFDDGNKYLNICKQYSNIYNLDVCDYNIYYMPNNTISNQFLNI